MSQNTGNLFTYSRCNRIILTTRRRAVVLIAALAAPMGFNMRDMVLAVSREARKGEAEGGGRRRVSSDMLATSKRYINEIYPACSAQHSSTIDDFCRHAEDGA